MAFSGIAVGHVIFHTKCQYLVHTLCMRWSSYIMSINIKGLCFC